MLNSIGFRVEYGKCTKSPSRLAGPGLPNTENENGATTSARSNSSGWLQTCADVEPVPTVTVVNSTYLAELHNEVHERARRVRIANVRRLL